MSGLRALTTRARASVTRLLERRRIRFVCISVLVMSLALLAVSFATADRGRTVFGPPLGADYAGFYVAGMLLNRAPPERLYDFALQDEMYHAVLPEEKGHLPFLHPPFVALAFRPLARLPYAWSVALWLLLSAGLYLAGLLLALKALPSLPGSERPLILLLALSFQPFIMECWLGGQLSAFGFCCVALAYYCLQCSRRMAAGSALGLCLYKPTLLVLLLPLLVVARCWRVLAGFGLTAVALVGVSIAAVGWKGCLAYARLLLGFTRTTTGGEGAALPVLKFVDLNSCFRLLFGGAALDRGMLALAVVVMVAVPLGALAVAWWRFGRGGDPRLVWAPTLTWTLLANLYVGVYDSILVVLSALQTAAVLYRPGKGGEPFRGTTFPVLLLLLAVAAWLSQHVARVSGLPLYSVALLALAIYQLVLAFQLTAGPAREGDHWRPIVRALGENDENTTPQEKGGPSGASPDREQSDGR